MDAMVSLGASAPSATRLSTSKARGCHVSCCSGRAEGRAVAGRQIRRTLGVRGVLAPGAPPTSQLSRGPKEGESGLRRGVLMARANKDDKSDDADETADEQAKDTVVQVLDYYEENFTQLWQSLGEPTKFSSAQEADAQISTLQRMIREMNEFDARITQLISAPKMNMRERFTLRILRYCNNTALDVLGSMLSMSVEASEELLGGHSKDPTAAGVDAQVEAEEANASPAAKSEDLATKLANEMAADANGDENLLLTMSGTLLVTVLAGVASVKIGDFVGLDVMSTVGVPEHPFQMLAQTVQWAVPAGLISFAFWSAILESDTHPGRVWREDLRTREEYNDLDIRVTGLLCLGIELAGGLISRGTGLAAITQLFAGIPSLQPQDIAMMDLISVPEVQYHLPALWVWPFIALGAGALDGVLFQLTQDGFTDKSDREYLQNLFSQSMYKALSLGEVQAALSDINSAPEDASPVESVRDITAAIKSVNKAAEENPDEEFIFPEGAVNAFYNEESGYSGVSVSLPTMPLSKLLQAVEGFQSKLLLSDAATLYGPVQYLIKGTILSAQTIIMGSIWPSVITGTAISLSEELASKVRRLPHQSLLCFCTANN